MYMFLVLPEFFFTLPVIDFPLFWRGGSRLQPNEQITNIRVSMLEYSTVDSDEVAADWLVLVGEPVPPTLL
jgi:hypothetical protein